MATRLDIDFFWNKVQNWLNWWFESDRRELQVEIVFKSDAIPCRGFYFCKTDLSKDAG